MVSIGSDVVYEYLDILPRLQNGVLVQVHDVFLPSDYPREVVLKNRCFWFEQYLLQAFLAFSPECEVLWSSSAMQIFFLEILEKAFPRWPQSYLRMSRDKRRFVPPWMAGAHGPQASGRDGFANEGSVVSGQ
ncbi:MAG: hypothetical protein DMG69_28900 [Acidobacteria bacterium]|nr:MAG: hypothetical protein DMG69_28900 [Acidobacteriota bacterium]